MGGVNQYVLKNWEAIDHNKFQFDFATLSRKPLDFEIELKAQGCKVHYISCYAEENRARFIDELDKIFYEGYDAVHLHTSYWKSFVMEEVAKRQDISVIVVHAHSNMVDIADDGKRENAIAIHEKLKSIIGINTATHFCACSNVAANWLFGKQIPRDRITILNNAINTEEFSYKPALREKVRKELGVEESFVIGHAGRFSYQKNHDMLVDIFFRTCKSIPGAKLLLIGDGELREQIVQKVNNLGISDRVLFLGKRNDMPSLFQAMDIFALPSRSEGLGLVLIEAQCAGLPCLASEHIPNEAKTTPNLHFLPYDTDIWTSKIIEIANGKLTRTDMSEETEKAGYSVNKQVRILERIYSDEI